MIILSPFQQGAFFRRLFETDIERIPVCQPVISPVIIPSRVSVI